MAKRYSGSLTINIVYDDKGHYRTSVSERGKHLWSGTVYPAAAGFGPGIAYDSPKAYDEIASSALAFADDEVEGIGDDAEFDAELTGYLIRRSPRSKSASHATKAKSTIKVGDCVIMREPSRKFLTSSTGGSHFKVVAKDGIALTLEGPLDRHPKHWERRIMGAQQFKKVKCQGAQHMKKSPSQLDREIAESIGRRR